jgi:hypothetical protein
VSDGPRFGELQFLFSALPTSLGEFGVSLPDHLLKFTYEALSQPPGGRKIFSTILFFYGCDTSPGGSGVVK